MEDRIEVDTLIKDFSNKYPYKKGANQNQNYIQDQAPLIQSVLNNSPNPVNQPSHVTNEPALNVQPKNTQLQVLDEQDRIQELLQKAREYALQQKSQLQNQLHTTQLEKAKLQGIPLTHDQLQEQVRKESEKFQKEQEEIKKIKDQILKAEQELQEAQVQLSGQQQAHQEQARQQELQEQAIQKALQEQAQREQARLQELQEQARQQELQEQARQQAQREQQALQEQARIKEVQEKVRQQALQEQARLQELQEQARLQAQQEKTRLQENSRHKELKEKNKSNNIPLEPVEVKNSNMNTPPPFYQVDTNMIPKQVSYPIILWLIMIVVIIIIIVVVIYRKK